MIIFSITLSGKHMFFVEQVVLTGREGTNISALCLCSPALC